MEYKFTKIWKVNKRLVVADTIEEAISLYKMYIDDNITNIVAVGDDNIPTDYLAIIKA